MPTTSSQSMIPTVTEFYMVVATRFLPEPTSLPKVAATLVAVITGTLPWEMHPLVPVTNASIVPLAGTMQMVRTMIVLGMLLELDVPVMATVMLTAASQPTWLAVPAVAGKAPAVPQLRLHLQHSRLLPRPMREESQRVARRRVLCRRQQRTSTVQTRLCPREVDVPLTANALVANARATVSANKQL